MENTTLKGRINSIQSLGTVDGPGVRFVVFFQGCNLRCGCCHNPDTWRCDGEYKEYSAKELAEMANHYKSYFGKDGGITISGGEPLLQAKFATELFNACHNLGINTCLDTSGSILNDNVKSLLCHTDRVLLDIKYPTDELYQKYVGCSIEEPLEFLEYLNSNAIPTTLRQVIIPQLNDSDESIAFLASLANKNNCVDKVELLPFKKICKVKYDKMGIDFEFDKFHTPTQEDMNVINKMLEKRLKL